LVHLNDNFRPPPQLHNQAGELRKVGFELEFTGLDIEQTGEILQTQLGGELQARSIAEAVLQVPGLGDFKIELDWKFLKEKAAAEDGNVPSQWLELLSQSAAIIVPLEIVCPPIALTELDRLTPVIEALREAGATGTKDSMLAAYGVHINCEAPRLDAATLSAYLRAFALLQWWLTDSQTIDFTRKLSPYIDLYPEAYLRQLFSHPKADLEQIFTAYLEHNASRNRALDMLPLLAEIDEKRVRQAVGDDLVQARPAFHFRLPDCHIEKAQWSLATAWQSWWLVEQLAEQKDALIELSERFLRMDRPLLGVSRTDWTKEMNSWLSDHGLV
jgi:hypothetical protein